MKDKGTAALLAFFLGPFGLHRFYLGQVGLGVVYLLFCWTPIIWLVAFIDFIAFLAGSKVAFDRKYNSHAVQTQQPVMQNNVNVYHQSPVITSASPQTGGATAQPLVSAGPASQLDDLEKLERLHNLKERGVLSEEEFAVEKAKILNTSGGSAPSAGNISNDPFLG